MWKVSPVYPPAFEVETNRKPLVSIISKPLKALSREDTGHVNLTKIWLLIRSADKVKSAEMQAHVDIVVTSLSVSAGRTEQHQKSLYCAVLRRPELYSGGQRCVQRKHACHTGITNGFICKQLSTFLFSPLRREWTAVHKRTRLSRLQFLFTIYIYSL